MAGGCATRAKRPASRLENILLFLENVHPFKTPKDGAQVLCCVAACRARYNPNEKCSIIGIAGL